MTFSTAIRSLKNHRLEEHLRSLSLFFYWQPHTRLFGKEIFHLRTCLHIAKTLSQYFLVIYATLFLLTNAFYTTVSPLILISYIMIGFLLSDALPRLLTYAFPIFFLRASSLITSILCLMVLPITFPLVQLTRWQRQRQLNPEQNSIFEAREKMMEILHDFDNSPFQDDQNHALLRGIVKYQDRIVREVMIPRIDIFHLSADTSIDDAAHELLKRGFTRVPVYGENIDDILGVIMAKDLLNVFLQERESNVPPPTTIAALVKPVLFTPETQRVSALLQEFRKCHVHLAIVVDEYGGTEGLVTIEDILEEIVGDIEDEYDLGKQPFTLLSDGSYLIDAHCHLLDLNEQLQLNIPIDNNYDTLSGYIVSQLGAIPTQGWSIHRDEFDLEVIECSQRSVETVRLKRHLSEAQHGVLPGELA